MKLSTLSAVQHRTLDAECMCTRVYRIHCALLISSMCIGCIGWYQNPCIVLAWAASSLYAAQCHRGSVLVKIAMQSMLSFLEAAIFFRATVAPVAYIMCAQLIVRASLLLVQVRVRFLTLMIAEIVAQLCRVVAFGTIVAQLRARRSCMRRLYTRLSRVVGRPRVQPAMC